ncbi:MAG: hypothetical protein JNL81_03865 [Hyphomonadaceae bacterium]|nr:hypothetical protein [Hyphomonadaceae bacterium]
MILRRIIAHFRKQEWTAIAIDFVIVVVGVFVGLQVNNWNEARAERAEEYGYLVRLHEDLTRSISTIERTVGMLERQAAGQTVFLDALAQCSVPPDSRDEIEYAISTLGYINAPIFSSRTYDELTSSGAFDIIENEDIRTGLSDVVRRVGHLNHTVENIYRLTEHHRFTVEENVLFTNIRPFDDFGSTASVEYDIGELCRDRKIASAVSAIRLQTMDRFYAYQALATLYRRLPPMIEGEIAERWGVDLGAAAEEVR